MKKKHMEIIKELSDKDLLFHLYVTQLLLLAISAILGFILFNDFSSFFDLFFWEDLNILYIGAGAGIAVVLADLLLMKIVPASYYDDGGLNERIFRNRNTLHIAVIAAIVAFCEELLFRGVIQTHFGLMVSSIIFAAVHYRYLFNWFLFVNIIVLSFLIGIIYLKTGNLAVTIVMHFLIDFLLGISIRYRKQDNIEETGRDLDEQRGSL
ncbi:CPBP family intramembrane metalloprotease [Bacillus infantis]|uniref:CPBP family intramembrane glutamic endopeptidase n=1 Tax=Bacillus infantis TaxID=324767 RepID=UPI001CD51A35|nr:CPBP family intramembrane glutamic endopeptidase [Bacillus infantis]MCA1036055.1 CPBP family intramembrane metalloprotease [Bacillus infantis]